MKLFHGSDTPVIQIDLNKCELFKDFGKGFYTTKVEQHANERAANVAAQHLTTPIVNVYDFEDKYLTNNTLRVKRFLEPSSEWVEFIMRCRDRKLPQPPHNYDIVEGPIANDKMRVQFALFERGTIDLETVLRRITYIEDTHQISFHTQQAIDLLQPEPNYPQILIESAIGMMTEFWIEDNRCDIKDALNLVYNSTTYKRLIDVSTFLYRETPACLYEMLKRELES
jgi:hypothetical protein